MRALQLIAEGRGARAPFDQHLVQPSRFLSLLPGPSVGGVDSPRGVGFPLRVIGGSECACENGSDFTYPVVTDRVCDPSQPVTTSWSLCTFDLHTGQLVQRIELGCSSREPRIENVDADLLLWTLGGSELFAHHVCHAEPIDAEKDGSNPAAHVHG